MNLINNFSLQKHDGEYKNWPRKSKLFFDGQDTGTKVSGYVVEKQFMFSDYFLLFINYDCPFEESYEIIALDNSYKVIGQCSFIPPWLNSYSLDYIEELSKNLFKLTFNEDTYFELKINYPKKSFLSKVLKVSRVNV